MKITKVKRFTLPDEIIKQIKKIIINGKLKPGDKLPPERELAEKFNVGRTTIREALKALCYVGIISKSREGTIINDINASTIGFFTDSFHQKLILKYIDLKDIIEVRKLLEIKNASLAAQRATIEDINIIQNILCNMEKVAADHNEREFIIADIEFHEAIAEATQNRILYELFAAVHGLLKKSQEEVIKYPGIIKCSLEYHKKIFNAIKERNVYRAKEEMLAHLDNIDKALISLEVI